MDQDRLEQFKVIIDECQLLQSFISMMELAESAEPAELSEKMRNVNDQCQTVIMKIDSFRRGL